jgi:hypothetical protein
VELHLGKEFTTPIRNYNVIGIYDELADEGEIIRKDSDGMRLGTNLTKQKNKKQYKCFRM